jgi:hypothetical protein
MIQYLALALTLVSIIGLIHKLTRPDFNMHVVL